MDPLLLTTNQPLLIEYRFQESEEESVAGSEQSHVSSLANSSIMQSIYNIGRNVVAGWSSQTPNNSLYDL